MSRIDNAIRLKRFPVKESGSVKLTIETLLGARHTLMVVDASLNGLGCELQESAAADESLHVNEIIPESKLAWDDQEFSLSRLVIRYNQPNGNGSHKIGLQVVDTKIPLNGPLGKKFDSLKDGNETPYDFELSAKKFNMATFMEADHSHNDIFEKCRQYRLLFKDCLKNPAYQYYTVRKDVQGTRSHLKLPGLRKEMPHINFASYDYLGLSQDPRVKEAAQKAIDKFGVSPGGSLTLCGKTEIHEELESTLAVTLGKEDALLFGSGFPANVGAITALLSFNDIVVADIYCHASIQDGIAASKAKSRFFKHNDMVHLEKLLSEHRAEHAGALLVTEGLFSMDGDVPDLGAFIDAARKYGAKTFIDEAHSFGVLGETGLGAAERCHVLPEIDVFMGTLSKGLGAGGGFVASSKDVVHWLRFFARAGMFSIGVSTALAAAGLKALQIAKETPELREKLQSNIRVFRKGLQALGFKLCSDEESPVVPVLVGNDEILGKMNKILLESGIFVTPVFYPAVPLDLSRFRFSLSAAHSTSDIELALAALEKAKTLTGYSKELSQQYEQRAA